MTRVPGQTMGPDRPGALSSTYWPDLDPKDLRVQKWLTAWNWEGGWSYAATWNWEGGWSYASDLPSFGNVMQEDREKW
jgi:hypothetical protein